MGADYYMNPPTYPTKKKNKWKKVMEKDVEELFTRVLVLENALVQLQKKHTKKRLKGVK